MISKYHSLTGASLVALALAGPVPITTQVAAASTVAAKPLKAQHRSLRPWHRSLRPWHRSLRPWHRSLRPWDGTSTGIPITNDPFRGDLTDFWGTTVSRTGGSQPQYQAIAPFWDDADTRWDSITTNWQAARATGATTAFSPVAADLRAMVGAAKTFWSATLTAQTGQSFDSYAAQFFARYGVDLNNPATLATLDDVRQSQLFVEWYDGLMRYSGRDNVDHWMNAINWTPNLTQVQGGGTKATIGVIDFFFAANDAAITSRVIHSGGNTTAGSNHGAAVASLILGAHDGRGVMGIAPQALVAAYNPFDNAGAAGWSDVIKGIVEVTRERGSAKDRASVVNLSLGEPGWTFSRGWRDVFRTSAVDSVKDHTLYVIAAGNDGITQTANVEMNGALDSTFIVVGSVDPNNVISDFSNRPGTVCLTDGGTCKHGTVLKESGLLMNRFIVAPGELLLVSDGRGGMVRQSGTSLAAPLVSGAVALIQDRWPWLKAYPRDVAQAILGSARDLGAPGIDPVYGVGLLDVEAAQSPLNFANLKYYLVDGGTSREVGANSLISSSSFPTWEARGAYFTAFEKLNEQERDFLIPLSSRLIGTKTGSGNYFQDYLYDRLVTYSATGSGFAQAPRHSFADNRAVAPVTTAGGWSYAMRGRVTGGYGGEGGYRPLALRSTFEVRAPEDRFAVAFGSGDGAVYLGGRGALALSSDFDPSTGGANPLLGFASGSLHVGASAKIAPGLVASFGASERQPDVDVARDLDPRVTARRDAYRANARTVRLDYAALTGLDVGVAYSRLSEREALFGVQSLERSDLGSGTTSDGVTVDLAARVGNGWSLFGTATVARTTTADASSFKTSGAGVVSSSYQLGVAKSGLGFADDALRLSLAAPLRITNGSLTFESIGVVNRETGEKGVVTQTVDLEPARARRLIVEGLYALPMLGGDGQFALFGRAELNRNDAATPAVMIGGNLRLQF